MAITASIASSRKTSNSVCRFVSGIRKLLSSFPNQRWANVVHSENQNRFYGDDQAGYTEHPKRVAVSRNGIQHELVRSHDGQRVFANLCWPFPGDQPGNAHHKIQSAHAADKIQSRRTQNSIIKAISQREFQVNHRCDHRYQESGDDFAPFKFRQRLFQQIPASMKTKPKIPRNNSACKCPPLVDIKNRSPSSSTVPPTPHAILRGKRMYR